MKKFIRKHLEKVLIIELIILFLVGVIISRITRDFQPLMWTGIIGNISFGLIFLFLYL